MQFVKSIWAGIFPRTMPYYECFRWAKEAGFDGIELTMAGEIGLSSSAEQVRELANRARESGIAIASLWVSPLSSNPLNSPSPEVRIRGVEAIRKAIEFASYLDCGALLLVPGRVGAGPKLEVGYQATWDRFTAELKKVIPDAERAKVILTIENVSNRFEPARDAGLRGPVCESLVPSALRYGKRHVHGLSAGLDPDAGRENSGVKRFLNAFNS